MDVALAFLIAISAYGIQGLLREEVDKQAKETTYRFSTHAIQAVGAVDHTLEAEPSSACRALYQTPIAAWE